MMADLSPFEVLGMSRQMVSMAGTNPVALRQLVARHWRTIAALVHPDQPTGGKQKAQTVNLAHDKLKALPDDVLILLAKAYTADTTEEESWGLRFENRSLREREQELLAEINKLRQGQPLHVQKDEPLVRELRASYTQAKAMFALIFKALHEVSDSPKMKDWRIKNFRGYVFTGKPQPWFAIGAYERVEVDLGYISPDGLLWVKRILSDKFDEDHCYRENDYALKVIHQLIDEELRAVRMTGFLDDDWACQGFAVGFAMKGADFSAINKELDFAQTLDLARRIHYFGPYTTKLVTLTPVYPEEEKEPISKYRLGLFGPIRRQVIEPQPLFSRS